MLEEAWRIAIPVVLLVLAIIGFFFNGFLVVKTKFHQILSMLRNRIPIFPPRNQDAPPPPPFVQPEAPENFLMFRIIIVGAKGVGKTAIARQFTERKWFDEPCTDKGIEFRPCYRFLNDKKDFIKFYLVDCPCADVVKYYNSGYMHGIIGCVIVFDLADRTSIEEALDWQETL